MTMPRTFLAAILLALTALPAMAQQLSLNGISRYLNSLTTLEAEFTQINADQTISTGVIKIQRPGRARFEYNPPDETLVIAGGQQLAVFDAKSNTGPEQYPLRETPLNLILARTVDLSRSGMVVGHDYDSAFSVAVVRFTSRPTRVYRIATSGDLIHWDDSNLGRFLPDLGTVTGREIGIPGGQRLFIRVSATKPLQP